MVCCHIHIILYHMWYIKIIDSSCEMNSQVMTDICNLLKNYAGIYSAVS